MTVCFGSLTPVLTCGGRDFVTPHETDPCARVEPDSCVCDDMCLSRENVSLGYIISGLSVILVRFILSHDILESMTK